MFPCADVVIGFPGIAELEVGWTRDAKLENFRSFVDGKDMLV